MTFVLPKDFSMFWKETEAIVRYQRSEVRYQKQHGSRAPVGAHERADFFRNREGVECHEGILAPRRIFA